MCSEIKLETRMELILSIWNNLQKTLKIIKKSHFVLMTHLISSSILFRNNFGISNDINHLWIWRINRSRHEYRCCNRKLYRRLKKGFKGSSWKVILTTGNSWQNFIKIWWLTKWNCKSERNYWILEIIWSKNLTRKCRTRKLQYNWL